MIRSSQGAFTTLFESQVWEDLAYLIGSRMAIYQATLESVESEEKEIRVAQGALEMANYMLDLPEEIEANYERLREEKDDE